MFRCPATLLFLLGNFQGTLKELDQPPLPLVHASGRPFLVCNAANVDEKAFLGYHRCIAYRFDEDYNGTVVSELIDPRGKFLHPS